MFTIEMDWDETAITILDQDGEHEDVQFYIYDDMVYIRQWDEDYAKHILITMSPGMFDELIKSMHLPEGSYLTRKPEEKS
jgi:hypothetical protein